MKKLTIVAVTSRNFELTNQAIDRTLKCLNFECEVVIVSHCKFRDNCTFYEVSEIDSIEEYNRIVLKELGFFVHTDYCLVVQYDGFAVDSSQWSDDFLNYDYVGAPAFDKENPETLVLNGGFSVRSKKLLEACKDKEIVQTPEIEYGMNEDVVITSTYRRYLEKKYGIKFAPRDVAARFSKEDLRQKSNPFGIHGLWNVPEFFSEDETIKILSEANLTGLQVKYLLRSLKANNYKRAVKWIRGLAQQKFH